MLLKILHEEAKPLGQKTSLSNTMLQAFGGLTEVRAYEEDFEITNTLTQLGSVVHTIVGFY